MPTRRWADSVANATLGLQRCHYDAGPKASPSQCRANNTTPDRKRHQHDAGPTSSLIRADSVCITEPGRQRRCHDAGLITSPTRSWADSIANSMPSRQHIITTSDQKQDARLTSSQGRQRCSRHYYAGLTVSSSQSRTNSVTWTDSVTNSTPGRQCRQHYAGLTASSTRRLADSVVNTTLGPHHHHHNVGPTASPA